jgi:hypothetical protein
MILEINKYLEWKDIYETHLEAIYFIFLNKCKMEDVPYFKDKFYELIYKKSSKRIPYYEKETELDIELNEW